MKLKLATECGRTWWRLRDWRVYHYSDKKYHWAEFRKLYKYHRTVTGETTHRRIRGRQIGVAFGPIMFFWRDE